MQGFGRKSRHERRKTDKPAWIVKGSGFGVTGCKVIDYSDTGAQIEVTDDLPATFGLSFSITDRRGKQCQVVWRNGNRAGVKFTGAEPTVIFKQHI